MKKKQGRKKQDRMASKGLPNPIDVHVGTRIRIRRTMMGLTQTTLGEQLGLTFQQVQKYERGANRVSSSRLYDLSRILDVPLSYFFDEMGKSVAKQSPAALQGRIPTAGDIYQDPAAKRETLELVRAYYAIRNESVRRKLADMIRGIAEGED